MPQADTIPAPVEARRKFPAEQKPRKAQGLTRGRLGLGKPWRNFLLRKKYLSLVHSWEHDSLDHPTEDEEDLEFGINLHGNEGPEPLAFEEAPQKKHTPMLVFAQKLHTPFWTHPGGTFIPGGTQGILGQERGLS